MDFDIRISDLMDLGASRRTLRDCLGADFNGLLTGKFSFAPVDGLAESSKVGVPGDGLAVDGVRRLGVGRDVGDSSKGLAADGLEVFEVSGHWSESLVGVGNEGQKFEIRMSKFETNTKWEGSNDLNGRCEHAPSELTNRLGGERVKAGGWTRRMRGFPASRASGDDRWFSDWCVETHGTSLYGLYEVVILLSSLALRVGVCQDSAPVLRTT